MLLDWSRTNCNSTLYADFLSQLIILNLTITCFQWDWQQNQYINQNSTLQSPCEDAASESLITLWENIRHLPKEDEKNQIVNKKSIQQKVFK